MQVHIFYSLRSQSFHVALTSLHRIEFPIFKPSLFDKKWFSHQFKGAGLIYDVAISLSFSKIIWAFGPYPFRSTNDMKFNNVGLKRYVPTNEFVVADNGHHEEKVLHYHMLTQRNDKRLFKWF